MPRFHPTPLFVDCWSSIGDITFYHRNGHCYWRRKPYTLFKGTPSQLNQSQIHHRAIIAWQQLPHVVQLQWREFAKAVPSHRPPYDNNHHISGYNLFVSAYHGFAQLNREHIPEPKPFPEFPTPVLDNILLSSSNGGDTKSIELQCCLTLTDVLHPDRWKLNGSIQLTPQGMGYNPGLMRSYIANTIFNFGI